MEIRSHTSLRGIAAVAVLGYHTVLAGGASTWYGAETFLRSSYLFVDLFFILSGFIIFDRYHSIFQNAVFRSDAYQDFLLRRIIRIYPNYFIWLLLSFGTSTLIALHRSDDIAAPGDLFISALMHLAMVQSLFGAPIKWNEPLWSVAVEFIAYIIFPVVAVLVGKSRMLALLVGFASFASLLAVSQSVTLDTISGATSVVRCLGGFALGSVLAFLRRAWDISSLVLSLVQLCACVAVWVTVSARFEILAVASFGALVFSTSNDDGALSSLLTNAALVYIGRISFSIYLSHAVVLSCYLATAGSLEVRWGVPFLSDWRVLFLAVLSLSVVVSAVSYSVWEAPSRQWLGRRLLGSTRSAAP